MIILLAAPLVCNASGKIPFMHEPPVADGIQHDGEWDGSLLMENYYQTNPGDNDTPSEKTVFRIGYDNENLYVLAVCEYSDLSEMRLFHCGRDNIDTDRVMLYFDTFNTKDKAYFFGANAYGEQVDGIVTSYHQHDTSSDIYFISAGNTDENGYAIEFAIPFKSIKYSSGKMAEWGLMLRRYLEKKDEEISSHILTRADPNYFNNYGIYSFDSLPSSVNLTVIPSVIGIISDREEKVSGTGEDSRDYNGELNIFYEPNSSLTFTGTVNPDYSTIEADAFQIDVNNRYPLYYSEKRPFFIEETNPFRANINIYHTRNVINPVWGFKTSYNRGSTGMFVLSSMDEEIPAARFGYSGERGDVFWNFFSFKKRVNSDSNYRFAAASRVFDGLWNNVVSFDSNLFFDSGLHFHNQIAASSTDREAGRARRDIAYSSSVQYDDQKWHFEVNTEAIGPEFSADMGFISEKGIRAYSTVDRLLIMSYSDTDFFRFADFSLSGFTKYDWDHKKRLSVSTEPYISLGFRYNLNLWIGMSQEIENYMEKDFYVNSYTARMNVFTFRTLGGFIRFTKGRGIWYDDIMPEVEKFRVIESELRFRPTRTIDVSSRLLWVDMENRYQAMTYGTRIKFQFHKNFWARMDIQQMKVEFKEDDTEMVNIQFYPLFVYQPSANMSIYAGMQRLDEEMTQITDIMDMETQEYFVKISYSVDII